METTSTADNSSSAPISEREVRALQREVPKLEALNEQLTKDITALRLNYEQLLIDNTNLKRELLTKTELLTQTQSLMTKISTRECEVCEFNKSDVYAAQEAFNELSVKFKETEQSYRTLLEQQANHQNEKPNPSNTAFHKIQVSDLPKFDGNADSLVNWIHHVETLKDIHDLKGTDLVKALPEMLTAKAREWLMAHIKNLIALHGHNWEDWKVVIQQQFRDLAKEQKLRTTYRALSIRSFQSFLEYINQKYSLRNKLYGHNVPDTESDAILIEDCLQFLTPNARGIFRSIWKDYCNNDPPSWNDFVRGITAFLSTPHDRSQYDPCILNRVPTQRTAQLQSSKTTNATNTVPPSSSPGPSTGFKCFQCGSPDHRWTACEKAKALQLHCEICQMKNHTTEMHQSRQKFRQQRTTHEVNTASTITEISSTPDFQ